MSTYNKGLQKLYLTGVNNIFSITSQACKYNENSGNSFLLCRFQAYTKLCKLCWH